MAPQVVLMTGGSSGVGLAMATRLARDPDKRFLVIATVISHSLQDDLVAALGDALGSMAFIHELDITKDDNITSVVEGVITNHGRIDILVNVAGVENIGPVEKVSRQNIDRIFNVNAIGTIRLTQAVIPHMKRQKAGRIITVTSILGTTGMPNMELYCSTKFALEGFFESFEKVATPYNICVCLIEPGSIRTPMATSFTKSIAQCLADESLPDIEREQLSQLHGSLEKGEMFIPMSDVLKAFMTTVEEEKPALRHPVMNEGNRAIMSAITASQV